MARFERRRIVAGVKACEDAIARLGAIECPAGILTLNESLSYDFFRLLGHNGAAIRDLKMPDSGGGWIANSLVYKDR